MTKKIKILWLSLLTALCAVCMAALALPSFFAKADTVNITTTGINDGNFSFIPGGAVPLDLFYATEDPDDEGFNLATARTMIKFGFKLENFDYENLANQVPHPTTWWGSLGYNVFIYEFTLLRGNHDGDGAGSLMTAEEMYSVRFVLFSEADRTFYGYIAVKDFYTTNTLESYIVSPLSGDRIALNSKVYYDDIATQGVTENVDGVNRVFKGGYTIKDKFRLSENNLNFIQDDGLIFNIVANVNSPFQYYCVQARYCFTTVSGAGMFETSYSSVYGEIYSSSRSVANILERMDALGYDFDEYFEDRAEWANRIIAVNNTQRVRIKYLTEIEGTPYATHNYAYVNVPVLRETIYIDDVEGALGISLRKCCDSNAYCFQKTTDTDGELYQLYYLKNVWLRSATVDGNYFDYFLDINDSYKEVYRPYVDAEILTNDIYEWIFSTQMINKFPALQNYRFNEIYGYFGLVVVPETYTLNSALKTMFDVETSKIGVISNFVFERTLSYEGYQELLSNYNYGFLSKLWSNVAGFVSGQERNATYYVIYSEPGTENALIGEGGQTDAENPGSVIDNEIIKPVGKVISNAWNGVLDFFTGLSKGTKVILYLVLGVIALIVGFKVYGIIKGNTKSRSKRK